MIRIWVKDELEKYWNGNLFTSTQVKSFLKVFIQRRHQKQQHSRAQPSVYIYGGLCKHNEMKDFKTDFISYVRRVIKVHKVELIFPIPFSSPRSEFIRLQSAIYMSFITAWSHSTRIFRRRNFPSSACTSVESVDKNRSTSFLILWLRFDGVASLCIGNCSVELEAVIFFQLEADVNAWGCVEALMKRITASSLIYSLSNRASTSSFRLVVVFSWLWRQSRWLAPAAIRSVSISTHPMYDPFLRKI